MIPEPKICLRNMAMQMAIYGTCRVVGDLFLLFYYDRGQKGPDLPPHLA